MSSNLIWTLVALAMTFIMLFANRKARVYSVFLEQLRVFKNAKTNKYSLWDIICFILLPIGLATVIVFALQTTISDDLAGVLTTIFSLVFTLLFGFSAILVGRIESQNKIEKQVVKETFVSIITATLLSLLSAILSIIIIGICNASILSALSLIVLATSFMNVMLLLLIIKRTHIIYSESKDN